MRHEIAADGFEAHPLDRHAQTLHDLVDVHLAAEDEPAVRLVDDLLGFLVVLVADLADDFLEQIFDRDEPRGAAVLVHDDRALRLLALELLQQIRHPLGLGHDHRRPHALP